MKVILNASNLHVGGGVQVASSFIYELSELLKKRKLSVGAEDDSIFSVICSSAVVENLPVNFDRLAFHDFFIVDTTPLSSFRRSFRNYFIGYDVCFSIFGPIYIPLNVKFHIFGFAQPWIAYPKNDAYQLLNFSEKLKTKFIFFLKKKFFKLADHLIVEQNHIYNSLIELGFKKEKLSIVNNTVSSLYDNEAMWKDIDFDIPSSNGNKILGFVGRPYRHKNIEILKKVDLILKEKYSMTCIFLFTFTDKEFLELGFDEIPNFYTVGSISVYQCPRFYKLIDALIFPSLLECFSISPLEAIKMGTPVLASDRDFISEVCGDHAFYFDPLDSENIADEIYAFHQEKKIISGKTLLSNFTATDRAEKYLEIITSTYDRISKVK